MLYNKTEQKYYSWGFFVPKKDIFLSHRLLFGNKCMMFWTASRANLTVACGSSFSQMKSNSCQQ